MTHVNNQSLKNLIKEDIRRILKEKVDTKLNRFYNDIVTKKKTYSEIIKQLRPLGNDYMNLTEIDDTLEFGVGNFEKYLERLGYKITTKDIDQLKINDIVSLIINIFYNNQQLKNLVSDNIIKYIFSKPEVIDQLVEYDMDTTNAEREDPYEYSSRGPTIENFIINKFKEYSK